MLPVRELAFAQQQLATIAHIIPKQFIAQYELLETAIISINHCTDLPVTLIHNDCHPGNALLTGTKHVTMLDWEGTGMGPAVLDIGFLLANCDGMTPWEPLTSTTFHPEEKHLQATIGGYCQYYQLTADELDHLPDAIRFRSLVFGACKFAESIRQKQNATFSQHWWTRYLAAAEITDMARRYFELHSH
jgi:Ser/Thr protein kinase RdoA (MazF antagonist)